MHALDQRTIRIIRKNVDGVYAVQTDHGVILTNNQWLVEWPHSLIVPSPALDRLFQVPKKNEVTAARLQRMDWRSELVPDEDNLSKYEELEPQDIAPCAIAYFTSYEWEDGKMVDEFISICAVRAYTDFYPRRYEKDEVYYDLRMMHALECSFLSDDPPEYRVHTETRPEKKEARVFCAFWDGYLRGALCNCIVRDIKVSQ